MSMICKAKVAAQPVGQYCQRVDMIFLSFSDNANIITLPYCAEMYLFIIYFSIPESARSRCKQKQKCSTKKKNDDSSLFDSALLMLPSLAAYFEVHYFLPKIKRKKIGMYFIFILLIWNILKFQLRVFVTS